MATRSGSYVRARLAALLLASSFGGCVSHGPSVIRGAHRPPTDQATPAAEAQRPPPEQKAVRARALETTLHPRARALIQAHAAQGAWAVDGMAVLPAAACAAAVGSTALGEEQCSLVALDRGATAVLLLRAPNCSTCEPRSWVFLRKYAQPLPLPTRRAADYDSLRAELSSDAARALWLAGFRGAPESRVAAEGTDDGDDVQAAPERLAALPEVSDYRSCTLAPDEHELLCRSNSGDLVGLDPMLGAQRLVVELGLAAADVLTSEVEGKATHAPPYFTDAGQLAMAVKVKRHALCGSGEQPCELVALVNWPSTTPLRPRLVAASAL